MVVPRGGQAGDICGQPRAIVLLGDAAEVGWPESLSIRMSDQHTCRQYSTHMQAVCVDVTCVKFVHDMGT
jgi:hypothetical protein